MVRYVGGGEHNLPGPLDIMRARGPEASPPNFKTMLTYHTYPHLLTNGGRLAATIWEDFDTLKEAVAATIALDPQAIVLLARVTHGRDLLGYFPGGMGVI